MFLTLGSSLSHSLSRLSRCGCVLIAVLRSLFWHEIGILIIILLFLTVMLHNVLIIGIHQ
ncbi:hypothetical protein D3C87_2163520 [compost metagenome]